jgi:hypothetical protein
MIDQTLSLLRPVARPFRFELNPFRHTHHKILDHLHVLCTKFRLIIESLLTRAKPMHIRSLQELELWQFTLADALSEALVFDVDVIHY